LSAGIRENAAEKKPNPVSEDKRPSTAAEMRALAEQAEAEAAEAEALAAAARARARAIQLRRQAEVAEATEKDQSQVAERAESESEDTARESEVEDTAQKGESEDVSAASVETDESAPDAVVEPDVDTEPSADSDVAAEKAPWYRRWRRPRLSTAAAILSIVIILAASAASVYMVLEHRDASHRRQLAAEFAAAARQGVVTLTSLDFNNAKDGVQRILDDSTGSFKDDFAKMAGDFTKVVEQSKVVEQGTVQAVAVDRDSMTDDSAVALVASTSEVTNAAGAKQDPRNFRLIVTLTRDSGQLKMSKVEFVP
jgi:Mce-associated membrane protein